MGMRKLFQDGQPFMAAYETYPAVYHPDAPAWCYEEEPGVWVIRYAGEHGDTVCEYGTEASEEQAHRVVDMLNGSDSYLRGQLRVSRKRADDMTRAARKCLAEPTQGALL